MFNLKNFRLTGIFQCPRCGTPCYSQCCGAVTTKSCLDGPELLESKRPKKRKKPQQSAEATMADTSVDSGHKVESKSSGQSSTPSGDAAPPTQETTAGFSEAREAIELSYRAGALMGNSISTRSPQADLAHFLSRPVLIERQAWDPAAPFSAYSFNPWIRLLDQSFVKEKITLYKMLSGTLKIRITVNGSPFHYGRVFVGVLPSTVTNNTTNLSPDDSVSLVNYDASGAQQAWEANKVLYSQRPHCFVNPSTNTTNIITWPFFHEAPFFGLYPATPGALMGMLEVWELNNLKMANGGTDPAMISFFAWIEDVCLVGIDANATMADEYAGNGIVSKPASAIARFASRFAGSSAIGKLARATEIGANAVGSIASLFGFSNPAIIDKQTIVARVQAGRMANTSGNSPCTKLSLDPKQEVSIDPNLLDLPSKDEMSFDYIAKIESLVNQINIATTDTGHMLGMAVHPMLGPLIDATSSAELASNCKCLTPVGLISTPFRAWRGSLVFRFQFVCSQMHRGRFAITYTPTVASSVGHATDPPVLNTYYSHIVDLSEETDVSIEVHWNQAVQFHSVRHFAENHTNIESCSGTALALNLPNTFANGRIDLHVINQVVAPDSSASIDVNVYMRAGDDFQLAKPDEIYQGYSYASAGGLYPLPDATMSDIEATMSIIDAGYERANEEDVSNQSTAIIINDTFVPTDTAMLFGTYFGEQILSIRALMKRFVPHNSYFYDGATNSKYLTVSIQQPNFPQGRSLVAYGSSGTDQQGGTGSNVWMTHIRWFSQAYCVYRGATRWSVGTFSSANNALFSVKRGSTFYDLDITDQFGSFAGAAKADIEDFMQGDNTIPQFGSGYGGPAGEQIFSNADSGVYVYEVPFYSPMRYVNVNRGNASSWGYSDMRQSHVLNFDVASTNGQSEGPCLGVRTYVAAGEDFSFHFFIGVPIIYEQAPRT